MALLSLQLCLLKRFRWGRILHQARENSLINNSWNTFDCYHCSNSMESFVLTDKDIVMDFEDFEEGPNGVDLAEMDNVTEMLSRLTSKDEGILLQS